MISFFFFIIYLGPMVLMMIVSTNETSGVFTHQKLETAHQTILDVLSLRLEQQNRGLVVPPAEVRKYETIQKSP